MRRAATAVWYLVVLAAGTYAGFRPTFDSGFARVQAETGDGMLNHYLLEHTWRVVSDPGYCGTFLSPPFFYPERLTLAYSESFLGVAPLYWGLRLGLPDHLAYQWWMILCGGLNVVAFAAAARWLGCGHVLAGFGGFLWAFALVHLEQAKHQQMIPRFWMPLAVYYAWGLATAPSVRGLNRCLGCLFLQTATCVYSGWFLGAGLLVFLPAAVLGPAGGRRAVAFAARRPGPVALVAAGWGVAFAAFFAPYAVANWGFGRAYVDCIDLIPTPAAWLTGPPGSRWAGTLRPRLPAVSAENWLFSGFAVYVLFIVAGGHAWLTRRDPARPAGLGLVGACFVTAGVWWLLTLSDGAGASGWAAARFIPGGNAIRCVSRVYTIVYLFGTLGGVVWLASAWAAGRPGVGRRVALGAVVVAAAYEQTGFEPPSMRKDDFYPVVDRAARGLAGADAGYLLPDPSRPRLYGDVVAMWAGLRANVPVVNGYSGRYPDAYPFATADGPVPEGVRGWFAGRVGGRVAVVDPWASRPGGVVAVD